jgi:hypothetical protein
MNMQKQNSVNKRSAVAATIHLVRLGDISDDDIVPTAKTLEAQYPGIVKAMKRGDIIENTSESGYRSQGVYMWDGKNVIRQNTSWDDYGSPSTEFKIVTEFLPGYWDSAKLSCVAWDKGAEQEFYWHSDYPPCALDARALGLDKAAILTKKEKSAWLGEHNVYWTTFMHNGIEYKINVSSSKYFKEEIDDDGLICVYWHDGELHTEY